MGDHPYGSTASPRIPGSPDTVGSLSLFLMETSSLHKKMSQLRLLFAQRPTSIIASFLERNAPHVTFPCVPVALSAFAQPASSLLHICNRPPPLGSPCPRSFVTHFSSTPYALPVAFILSRTLNPRLCLPWRPSNLSPLTHAAK